MDLKKAIYLSKQYGLYSPYGIPPILINRGPRVLVNSVPKAGTNLLLGVLTQFWPLRRKISKTINNAPLEELRSEIVRIKPGQISASHLYYSNQLSELLSNQGIRQLFIVRDPRDIAVSSFIYITYKDPKHRLHDYFANTLKNDEERLSASLMGVDADKLPDGRESLSIMGHMERYKKWIDDENVYLVRFEDLIGPEGGGDMTLQRKVISGMAEFLGIELHGDNLDEIADSTFSTSSKTFNKGVIGNWTSYFTEKHLEAVSREANLNLMKKYGYNVD